MLKKKVTYTDFNGVEQTEELFFYISKIELTEMQSEAEGGLDKKITKILETKNVAEAMKLFATIIAKAYGVQSEDGKRFIKNEQLTEEFVQSLAYEQIYSDIINDEDAAISFVVGVLPKDIAEKVQAEIKHNA